MTQNLTVLLTIALTGLVLLALLAKLAKQKQTGGPWPFYVKRPLTEAEQTLYWSLVRALPGKVILAQVSLYALLGIKKGHKRMEWLNRINRMSVDFVICDKSFKALAVIELDDASHDKPARVGTDAKKDKVLADAGLRLVRWRGVPDTAAILAEASCWEQTPQPQPEVTDK